MRPDFVIIGAQKAGSTALMRVLGEHPEVHMPPGETRYFRDPWFQMESPSVLDAQLQTDRPGVRRRGIKSPDLLGDVPCAQRLHDVLGDVDLIAILREPVDRAISAYFYYMQWGLLPLVPVESGLRSILAGEWTDQARAAEILEFGLYGKHLRRFTQLFPPQRLVTVLDEDLRADFAGTAGQVLAHLGVDTTVPLKRPSHLRSNEGVYSTARLRFLQRRQRYIVRSYPGYPGKYLQGPDGLRSRVMNRSIAAVDRLVLARLLDNSKPTISARLRGDLYAYYREDIRALSGLLGRDLSSWDQRNEKYIASHS
jgi:hypothetical protein